MAKSTNEYVRIYKAELEKGDIQVAYARLLGYLHSLKAHLSNRTCFPYRCGNISPGYLDYSYFPFFDEQLRAKKLRFGIVLNHKKMQFELWLMGQNTEVQKEYWQALKHTIWNEGRAAMPRYSVLETVLVEAPDFSDPGKLSSEIESLAISQAKEIIQHI